MSRGLGFMQRFVLDYLDEKTKSPWFDDDEWFALGSIAACLRNTEIARHNERTGDQIPAGGSSYVDKESLRRAIRRLAEAGRVETCQRWPADGSPRGLHCRYPADQRQRLSVGDLQTLNEDTS